MLKKYGPLFILAGLIVIMAIASPYFLTADNLETVAKQTAVIGVLTIGELLVIITGGIDLTVGAVLAFSMVISALMLKAGVPLVVCILAALAIGAAVGYLNGFIVTKMKLPPFIATLGMTGVLRGAALIITDGLPVSSLPESINWFGNGTVLFISVPILILAVLAISFQRRSSAVRSTRSAATPRRRAWPASMSARARAVSICFPVCWPPLPVFC